MAVMDLLPLAWFVIMRYFLPNPITQVPVAKMTALLTTSDNYRFSEGSVLLPWTLRQPRL